MDAAEEEVQMVYDMPNCRPCNCLGCRFAFEVVHSGALHLI